MKRRLGLLYWSVKKSTWGGLWTHWLINTFGPHCTWWGQRGIEKIEHSGTHRLIQLRNVKNTLYYPENLPLRPLYQVITELLYPWNWHYYQITPTTVTEADVVYDCGSAEGLFALQAAEAGATVIAFEPLPVFVDCLQQTLKPFPQAGVENLALGESKKTVYLKENGIYSTIESHTDGIPVEMNTIDGYVAAGGTPPTYIKADIEGCEPLLLAGAKATIQKYRPRLAITVYHDRDHAEQLSLALLNLVSNYNIITKGIAAEHGSPVMLHAWVE